MSRLVHILSGSNLVADSPACSREPWPVADLAPNQCRQPPLKTGWQPSGSRNLHPCNPARNSVRFSTSHSPLHDPHLPKDHGILHSTATPVPTPAHPRAILPACPSPSSAVLLRTVNRRKSGGGRPVGESSLPRLALYPADHRPGSKGHLIPLAQGTEIRRGKPASRCAFPDLPLVSRIPERI